MSEKISIIMTSYNYANYIPDAIESIIAQTYTNWELIIVDDASIDNSAELIAHYQEKDPRIKLIRHNQNLGLAKAIQTGLENAKTEWVAFLESDDIFFPNALEEKVKAIQTGADIIFTDIEAFQDKERILLLKEYCSKLKSSAINLDKSQFIDNFSDVISYINIIPTFSSVMLKRSLLLECNFNSFYKPSLDHYLWSQLARYKVFYINKKLTKWRLHNGSYITKDTSNWIKKYLFCISIYYNTIKHKSFIKRLFLTLNYMRVKLFYIKFCKNSLKVNMLNNKFVLEKTFNLK